MTTFTDEVRATVSPWKFGGSRRAAAAYLVSLDGCADAETGDAHVWYGWAARIGRTVLLVTDHGFVYATRYPSDEAAQAVLDLIDSDYGAFLARQESELEAN